MNEWVVRKERLFGRTIWRQSVGQPEISGRDDLTAISGIGITAQDRLYRAGIKTYTQLARTTLADLQVICGKFERVDGLADWISKARDLAETIRSGDKP